MGTELRLNKAYHPQTDRQTEQNKSNVRGHFTYGHSRFWRWLRAVPSIGGVFL